MALSNTATPKYYAQFREKVIAGEIPVSHTIEMEMNRIDDLIANPRYFYDDGAIDGFIAFCENEMTLVDGSDLTLLDSFKLWAESLLSWFYFEKVTKFVPDETGHNGRYVQVDVKRRLVNKQYLIVARGAAKSMYMAFIHAYFLTIDPTTTHQIATAPTMPQAEETLSPFKTAITRSRGPLFKFLSAGTVHATVGAKANRSLLTPTKKGIENFSTNSLLEVRPMNVDKLQGLRSKVNTIDEWLSGDVRQNVISALEQGASKLNDWVIVAVSSEGTVRNGVGDSIKMELLSILKGEYYDPHSSIWYYRLDDVSEVGDPNMWIKALMTHINEMSLELKMFLPQGMTFWQNDSASRARDILTSSSTKKQSHTTHESSGKCLAPWVRTFLRVTTSVRSRSCSHYLLVISGSRLERTSPLVRSTGFRLLGERSMSRSSEKVHSRSWMEQSWT